MLGVGCDSGIGEESGQLALEDAGSNSVGYLEGVVRYCQRR